MRPWSRPAPTGRPPPVTCAWWTRPPPDAYALPGRPHRAVVTTAMLRGLDGPEREALLAHERAHNAGGHHYALAAAGLAAHCRPALRRVRDTVRLAAERAPTRPPPRRSATGG